MEKPYGLVLDSSVDRLTLGISRGAQYIASYSVQMTMQTMERCMDQMEAFLSEHGVSFAELGFLVVVLGPGGYTSLRLGVTTMKTIAQVQDIPLIGVTVYDAMMLGATEDQVYLGVIPGRKGHVNCQLNRVVDGAVEPLSESLSLSYDRFYEFIGQFEAPIRCRVLGNDEFVSTLKSLGQSALVWDTSAVQIEGLLAFGLAQVGEGSVLDLSKLHPIYAHDAV